MIPRLIRGWWYRWKMRRWLNTRLDSVVAVLTEDRRRADDE